MDRTDAAVDAEEDNDVPDVAEGKLFGNVDDNGIDEEGKFDVAADETGIVPPGGADPVFFGRPGPATLLLMVVVELLPAVLPGNVEVALSVGDEPDCGKGIVGKFGMLLPTFWLAGPFEPPGTELEFWPRIPPEGRIPPLIRGFIPRFEAPGPPIGPPIIIGPFDIC